MDAPAVPDSLMERKYQQKERSSSRLQEKQSFLVALTIPIAIFFIQLVVELSQILNVPWLSLVILTFSLFASLVIWTYYGHAWLKLKREHDDIEHDFDLIHTEWMSQNIDFIADLNQVNRAMDDEREYYSKYRSYVEYSLAERKKSKENTK